MAEETGGERMTDQEKREKVIKALETCMRDDNSCDDCPLYGADGWCESAEIVTVPKDYVKVAIAMLKAQEPITGETSDGYHTFNELYHHRAVLFSVIVANYPDRAWKAKKHHDGTMYDGMFIVGIDTPDGQATYHYDIDPYWNMFKCRVLDNAPEWDGHTPAQAIERIGKLALLKAQELRYTPREVRNTLIDYGQHDLDIELGEVIKYDPVQVEDILMNGRRTFSVESALRTTSIPADIAQKLGVEPKEGV